MRYGILLLVILLTGQLALGASDAWQDGIDIATSRQNQSIDALKTFNPEQELPQFQRHPQQESSYKNPSQLKTNAQVEQRNNIAGQAVTTSNDTRNKIIIDKNDKSIQRSKTITDNPGAVIGDINHELCAQGTCQTPASQNNNDFDQAVSALSAADAASKDKADALIFPGHGSSCRKTILGFRNCCSDKGWGIDIGLASCSTQEKQLGKDKENGLTIYVDDYCAHHLPWPFNHTCTERRKTYCSFGSKLARIIQENGRSQLHLDFGTGKHPNCKGLKPSQLQAINFEKINFEDYQKELHDKIPNRDENGVSNKIAGNVKQQHQQRH